MPDFLLRDLPEDLMTALRQRADYNGRSLQSEMRHTLAESVRMPWGEWAVEAAALRARTVSDGQTASEAIRAAHDGRDAAIDSAPVDDDARDPLLP